MKKISIIIPAYNAGKILGSCLESLKNQSVASDSYEIILVDDGSTDNTLQIAHEYHIKALFQNHAGAAAARNLGAREARGEFLLFTDSDCEVSPQWVAEMIKPFKGSQISGVKGAYKTRQKEWIARLVQLEYEDRYRFMAKDKFIDFIDTYSAAYRRDVFMENGGFDVSYTTASGEDSELSYKLQKSGHKLVFHPDAIVYHKHPDTLIKYLKKKYRNAFWRALTWKKHPSKIARDSHTPNILKLQTLLAGLIPFCFLCEYLFRSSAFVFTGLMIMVLFASAIPFSATVIRKDFFVGLTAPVVIFLRAFAYAAGAGAKLLLMIKDSIEDRFGIAKPEIKQARDTLIFYEVSRRIFFDILLAGALYLLFSPLILMVAFGIKISSAGPIIYKRRVLGKGGRPFDAYKLRTMSVNAESVLRNNHELRKEFEISYKIKNDPRITSIGRIMRKLSIDELPQFINVLRGQMSLVGPRMISPPEISKYGEYQQKLLSVKPGVTGWWQVRKRQTSNYAERVQLDMDYLDKRSFLLDLKIIVMTVPAVFSTQGAL